MVNVLITGVSVVDFIFQLNEIPKENEKFRAENASISGGGIAANAAVAISRLGGTPTLVSRLGYDQIGSMIKNDLIEEGVNVNFTKQFQGNRSSFSSVYIDKKCDRQVVNYRDKNLPDDASWIYEIDEHDDPSPSHTPQSSLTAVPPHSSLQSKNKQDPSLKSAASL